MTIDEYNKATEILENISEAESTLNMLEDLVSCNPEDIEYFSEEEKEQFLIGYNDAKKLYKEIKEHIIELKEEFKNL